MLHRHELLQCVLGFCFLLGTWKIRNWAYGYASKQRSRPFLPVNLFNSYCCCCCLCCCCCHCCCHWPGVEWQVSTLAQPEGNGGVVGRSDGLRRGVEGGSWVPPRVQQRRVTVLCQPPSLPGTCGCVRSAYRVPVARSDRRSNRLVIEYMFTQVETRTNSSRTGCVRVYPASFLAPVCWCCGDVFGDLVPPACQERAANGGVFFFVPICLCMQIRR